MRVLGVIPARYASTRLPGKPLADLGGEPMVVRVWQAARQTRTLDAVVVATDHEDVAKAVASHGGLVEMTGEDLRSGSDRVESATRHVERKLGHRFNVVVNIQGDEPFLPGEAIDLAVLKIVRDPDVDMATLAVHAEAADRDRLDVVKLVVDKDDRALYFSRAGIPFDRNGVGSRVLRHLGLYVFRREYLDRYVSLSPSTLELSEDLEQLRALEDGALIRVVIGDWPVMGVDTPQDLEEARALWARQGRNV